MTERAAIVQAIRDNPDDDTAKLIYADFLDDHGEPERAELIRVTVRLTQIEAEIQADIPPTDDTALWVDMALSRIAARGAETDALRARHDALGPWMNNYPPPIPGAFIYWSTPDGYLPSRGHERAVYFRRGLVVAALCSAAAWAVHGPALLETDPCPSWVEAPDADGFTPGLPLTARLRGRVVLDANHPLLAHPGD